MNRLFLMLITSLFIISACNSAGGNKEKAAPSADSTAKADADAEKIKEAAAAIDDTKEALSKLTPVSAEDLKKLLPQTISGAAQENGETENSSGANIASADYKINDSTAITLSIIDCAGPAGVGIYNTQHLGMAAAEGETEEEYTKAITINGDKGHEHCIKEDNDCTLVWFTANRYLVLLEGESAANLKKIAGELKIK
jgi:hypothetical protein